MVELILLFYNSSEGQMYAILPSVYFEPFKQKKRYSF